MCTPMQPVSGSSRSSVAEPAIGYTKYRKDRVFGGMVRCHRLGFGADND
jgi:hypothetical protein